MYKITLIAGDGTGPEIVRETLKVINATGIDIQWEKVEAGQKALEELGAPLPQDVIESIRNNKCCLKGPVTTPIGEGFRSINVELRQKLNLYANVRPAFSLEGVKSPFSHIDLVVIRENTEDLYSGIEREVDENTRESIKLITRQASEKIARFAFGYAQKEGRKKVTVVHKANILKLTDGLFLECAKKIASEFGEIEFEERIVDNMCMQLVQKPELYDILLCPNLYGDIISDLCAGLVGGLGLVPSANIGDDCAIFEAIHGSAPKYTGQNKVNPTALIFSAVLMLKHLGENEKAEKIFKATNQVIKEGRVVTYDLGGKAKTSEMAEEIIEKIKEER